MLNVYVLIVRQLLDRCTGWIPQSACRGHSLTASGQPSSHTLTKTRFIFHIHASPTTTHPRSCLSQRTCLGPNLRITSVCDYWKGQEQTAPDADTFPSVINHINPQSQTGGAASASCQGAAVTSAEMGFDVDCLSAEIHGTGRADATLWCVVWVWLLRALCISHLSI